MKILFTQVVHQFSHNHLLVHFPLLHHFLYNLKEAFFLQMEECELHCFDLN